MGILLKIEDDIATILLDRAQQKNAMSLSMWQALLENVERVKREQAKVVVLRGAAHCFSAGADLSEVSGLKTAHAARLYWNAIRAGVMAICELQATTIAWIEGYCIGGGCLLALACDLRIAARTAQFSLPEARLGILPDRFTVTRLVSLIGLAGASEMLLLGDTRTADQALHLGLINEVVVEDRLADYVNQTARTIARNDSGAVLQVKRLLKQVESSELSSAGKIDEEEEERIALSFLAPQVKERIKRIMSPTGPS